MCPCGAGGLPGEGAADAEAGVGADPAGGAVVYGPEGVEQGPGLGLP